MPMQMLTHRRIYCVILTLVSVIGFWSGEVWGQTNPVAQSLSYTQTFTLAANSTTYPTGWQGWSFCTTGCTLPTNYITTAPTGDRALIASSNANIQTGGIHNYNGKIGILHSGSYTGAICLAINTTGSTNINVSYEAMTIRNPYDGTTNTRINGFSLQYRIGTSGSFIDLGGSIDYSNNTTNQTTAVTTPQNLQTRSITLPFACENQSVVQLRWVVIDISGGGSRPSFAIDNISINSVACTNPTSPAFSLSTSSVTNNSVVLSWKRGNASSSIVKINTINTFTDPIDGTDPIADPSYSGGEQVVYNGAGRSVTITDLQPNTQYCFRVYEYNCSGSNTKYNINTATGNPNCVTTVNCFTNLTNFSPSNGPVGTVVTLTGTNFLNVTSVLFGGVSAAFTKVNNTTITAIVPVDAATGLISVIADCQVFSGSDFTVIGRNCPEVLNLIISELCDPQNSYQTDRYIEIYNPTSSSISLTGWEVRALGNYPSSNDCGNMRVLCWPLSGNIAANTAMTCGYTSPVNGTHNFTNAEWKAPPTTDSTCFVWNGQYKDGAALYQGGVKIDGILRAITNTAWWADKSLVRNSNIGTPSPNSSYTEWTPTAAVTTANTLPATPGTHTFNSTGSSPVITVPLSQVPVCSGTVINLNITASGGTTPYSYQWKVYTGSGSWQNPGVGFSGTTTATLSFTATSGMNNYQFYCEVTSSGNSCYVASNAIKLTVNPLPVTTATNNSPMCQGSGALNFTGGPGSMVTYAWTGPNSYSNSTQSPSIAIPTPADNGTYSLTVTDGNGCTATISTFVSITAIPDVPGLTAPYLCEGTMPQFTATGGSIYEFLVDGVVKQTASSINTFTPVVPLVAGKDICVRSYSPSVINGVLDSKWGTPLATSAGGAVSSFGAGNNMDALYMQSVSGYLFGAIAGNLVDGSNNRILLFIDCKSGGLNVLDNSSNLTGAPYWSISNLGKNGSINFDPGFFPDYVLGMNQANGGNAYFNLYDLQAKSDNYLGDKNSSPLLGFSPNTGFGDYTKGFEFAIPMSALGSPTGTIQVFAMIVNSPPDEYTPTLISNQFLTRANVGEGSYGNGTPAIFFGSAAPNPVTIPLLSGSCPSSETCLTVTTQWTGSNSTNWETNSNWSCGSPPNSSTSASIPTTTPSGRMPVINPTIQADCRNLEIQSGATLTIQSDATSSGSLIMNGVYSGTGNVIYNRYIEYNRWYITSSPVNNSFSLNGSTIDIKDGFYNFAPYVEADNYGWNYAASIPTSLNPGQGYLLKLLTGNTLQYTGAVNPDITVSVSNTPSTPANTVYDNGWNAVGNPFTSALKITGADGFITQNISKLESNYNAVYLWYETGSYTGTEQYFRVMNNSGYFPAGKAYGGPIAEDYVQAGQGFLINAGIPGTSTVVFKKGTAGMQVHSTATTFKKTESSWPGLTLLASTNGRTRSTVVAFNEQMTTGLDETYDAGLLSASGFNLYTHLVAGSNETDFTIQCLPEYSYDSLCVPVGIDLPEAGKLTFKACGVILPERLFPVLEDRLLQQNTALKSETDSLTVLMTEPYRGVGRFYLHIGGISTVGTNNLPEVRNFAARFADQKITVFGTPEPGSRAWLYDMSGRKLGGEYRLTATNQNEIPAAGLANGIYLLRIEGRTGSKILKITILNR